MTRILLVGLVCFALAVVMTMTGRGGGNFYVLTLVLAGRPMHEAATTGQFVLFWASLTAALVFGKAKTLSVPLALFLGVLTAGAAFFGGYFSVWIPGRTLKAVFAGLLAVAGLLMLKKVEPTGPMKPKGLWTWHLALGNQTIALDLRLVVPVTLATGFFSGMVGVSGGSFLVPLMVLGCDVPMKVAVGTASAMVSATAFTGFLGHALRGEFNPHWAVPVAALTVGGGLLGGKLALKSKPKRLKLLFAVTTLVASAVVLAQILTSRG